MLHLVTYGLNVPRSGAAQENQGKKSHHITQSLSMSASASWWRQPSQLLDLREKKNFLNGAKLAARCLTPLSIAFKMSSSKAPHIYIFIFRQAQGTSGSSTFIFNRIMES